MNLVTERTGVAPRPELSSAEPFALEKGLVNSWLKSSKGQEP